MGRRKKCVECRWVKSSKKKYAWECTECNDTVPCKTNDCGHLECHFEKARSCHLCGKRIPNTGNKYYFVDGPGATNYAVHKGCSDEAYSVETYEV
jgi:hypothetical protein